MFRGYEIPTGKREVFEKTGIETGSTLGHLSRRTISKRDGA
jgi:hypothetical protein